ncbi:hypothetical protein Tco_1311119 [Tanacetum coccineum]
MECQSISDRCLSGMMMPDTPKCLRSLLLFVYTACKKRCCTEDKIGKENFSEEKGVQKGYVSKQGRKSIKSSKGEPSVHKDPNFEDLDDFVDVDDTLDYMETEDDQDEGRTSSMVLEEKESAYKEVSTKAPISTVKPNEGTDKRNEGTNKQDGAPTTSTPTPTIFGDDETIAQVLITMSQNKQKKKGVKIRNVKDTERPRPTSIRSVLTLKPLPKIDPKDKGKKIIDEEGESDTELDDITEAEKKFKMLAKDEGRWPKSSEEMGSLKRKRKYKEARSELCCIKILLSSTHKSHRRYRVDFRNLKIMMESSTEENDQELKDGTIIYMLVERRYPLSKEYVAKKA